MKDLDKEIRKLRVKLFWLITATVVQIIGYFFLFRWFGWKMALVFFIFDWSGSVIRSKK